MGKFKEYLRRRKLRLKRRKKEKGFTSPSNINLQNYTNAVNYINTPPYGTPPQTGGFTDSNFPGYPTS